MIRLLTRNLFNPTCNQNRPCGLVRAGQIIHKMIGVRVQRRVRGYYMRTYRVRITTEVAVHDHCVMRPARVEAAQSGILGFLAEECEEEGCEGWEAGAYDAEAGFDAGPECGVCEGI